MRGCTRDDVFRPNERYGAAEHRKGNFEEVVSDGIIIRKKFSEEDESHAPEETSASLSDRIVVPVLRTLPAGAGEGGRAYCLQVKPRQEKSL